MSLTLDLLKLALLGGFITLDETAFLQVMASRPIVVGPLVGWLIGDLESGLLLGSILELIYLDVLPAGAAHFPDSGLAAVVGTGVLELSEKYYMKIYPGTWLVVIMIAILTAYLGGHSITFLRRRNAYLLKKVEGHLAQGRLWAVAVFQGIGLIFSFIRGWTMTLVLTAVFLAVVKWAGVSLGLAVPFPLIAGRNLIICASLALGVRLFVKSGTFIYFVFGACIALTFLRFGV